MSAVKKPKATRQPVITPLQVDLAVNAAFAALTHDLGRPFTPGGRNVRSIVRQWCPLLQEAYHDMDVDSFTRDYISSHFFDRYFYVSEGGVHGTLEDQALEKFKTNLGRGMIMNKWTLEFLPYGRLNSILQSASLEIAHILGDFDVEQFYEFCTHGPNATVGVKKEDSYLDRKFMSWDGTLSALTMLDEYLEWNSTLSAYYSSLPCDKKPERIVVAGNRLSFVPKKFDSLRTMSVEPTVNQFFQQGYGKYMTSKLRRAGIDLETQDKCHQALVKVITTHDLQIATIDWSQASDRIWLKLCQRLLPSDWYAALEDIRSPVCTYRGRELTLTMAGSMGAGFTFPLQTLLFLTLIRALARETGKEQFVSVFGDDCICDTDLLPEVEWLASQLKWTLNASKSFSFGPFRESCGADMFRGVDCRPFFVERPDDLYSKAALAAWAYGVYNGIASRLPSSVPLHARNGWLTSIFSEWNLGPLQYVPFRFSLQAGIRVKNPLQTIPTVPTTVSGSDAEGWSFRFIGNMRKRVPVDPEPYYLWSLMGKGIPQDFKKGCIDPLEVEAPEPDHQSRVPWKGVKYGYKTGYVHTWHYYTDND